MKQILALALLILLCGTSPASVAAEPIDVYYAGPEGSVLTALTLSESFHLVVSSTDADVLVLNGTVRDPEALSSLVRSGTGLVLIPGQDLTAEAVARLFGVPVALTRQTAALSLTGAEGVEDPTLKQIVWNSAPQIRNRAMLDGVPLDPLVVGYGDKSVVVGSGRLGQGQFFYFAGMVNGEDNPQIRDWPFFNYFIYQLTARAAGQSALSFGDYPGSPVPHARERNALFALLAFILVSAWTIFFFVRRYSLAHPEILDRLVADKEDYVVRQVGTDWEDVGFHRPLAGFLIALTIALLMSIPMTIYGTMILRVYILPSAQAWGIYDRVTQFFSLIWTVFDVGTAIVFIRFFSQHRVHDPARAIKYGQFFVWWQALTGTLQIALVTVVAGIWLPQTAYALYAWIAIAHCMVQIPGFYAVFRYALAGWQRFDYAQIIDLIAAIVIPLAIQPIIVLTMVAWGRDNPAIGASMGGLYGLAATAYVSMVLAFLLGFFLYRRLGYNAKILFMAHFDLRTIKETFRFGIFEMLGSSAFTAGQAAEIMIITAYLINYNEVWGNWGMAQGLAALGLGPVAVLYGNILPAMSEAIANGREKLSRYYAAMAFKWGGMLSGFYCASLLAVLDRFIIGATGAEFHRAADYSFWLIIYMAMPFPTWVNDMITQAANRPYFKTMTTAAEQILRITLVLLLIERFQIYALVYAYMVAIMSKNLVSYWLANRYCLRQRFHFWQTLGAPVTAGLVHYALLRWVTGLIWEGDQISSLLVYIIGIIPSFPLYAFLYGLFGGWDDHGLAEFKRAVDLSSFVRPVAWILWKASALGAGISPLHGRFPITGYAEAMEEARSLTGERVVLVGGDSGSGTIILPDLGGKII